VPIGDDGFARFTFWEKTYPDEEKPIVTCGLKTSKPGNYTLDIIRPDDVNLFRTFIYISMLMFIWLFTFSDDRDHFSHCRTK